MTFLAAVSHWQVFDWSVMVHCHGIQISHALSHQHKLKFPPKIENHVMYTGDMTVLKNVIINTKK